MAVYQNSTANLGVKLEITHASPDIANNRTTITYKASVYKTGSHNPKNGYSQTPMYLTINGESLLSTTAGNYNLEGSTTSQLIKTGTLIIPHGADGSKSFTFSWNVNFTSTNFPNQDFGYRSVTTSGTYVLPSIARASTFTIPSTTITTGSAFTVTIARASGSFTHKVSYIVGNSEVVWSSNATTSYAATVPHILFNSHKSTGSVSGVIRVTTMNGSVEVGSNQRAVTINLASSEIPVFSSVTYTNSNKGMFSRIDQFIRGISRATATVNTPIGAYSSTIATYEFRYRRGTSYSNITSKTTSSHQFEAFTFPNSGSENGVYLQARVRDSRGRYSAWKETTDIRVHYYTPPAIGNMTVRRTGTANTTLQVTRTYTVIPMYELAGTTNSNTASLTFQHRVKGSSTVTNNTGAGSTVMTLSNSNANLTGAFAANTSYEVRAILTDKLNTVYSSWISVGTEFVPMDIGPRGVGIGKVHSNGASDLEVGSGGISSEGPLRGTTFDAIDSRSLNPNPYTLGATNRGLSVHFKQSAVIALPDTGLYGALLDIQAWTDTSGGPHQQLAINSEGEMFGRLGLTSWGAWRRFLRENSNGTTTINGVPGASTVTIGSVNSGWVHFTSSSSPFHFNRQVSVAGHVYAADASGNGYGSRLARVDEIPSVPAAYTPTGGGSGDNRWIRFPSGHQICWGSTTTTGSSKAVTFPRAFTATPMITVTGHHASHSPATTLSAASASAATFYIVDGRNGGVWGGQYTSGMTATLRYIAVGIG